MAKQAKNTNPGILVGYARVSSIGQDLTVQIDKLKDYGVSEDNIYQEKKSGLDAKRPGLEACLKFLRQGDTLVVTRADRLGRSTGHLLKTIEDLKAKGVDVIFLDQSELNTNNKYGSLMLTILAGIAQFETELRKERQAEGIAKAQRQGVRFGRKRELTQERCTEIKAMRNKGKLIKDIMSETGLSKASVYRALK